MMRYGIHATIVAALVVGAGVAGTQMNDTPDSPADIPACQHEDSRGPCHWDAKASGDGRGTSFVIDADQRVTYLP